MTDISGPLPAYLVEAVRDIGRNIPRLRSADMVLGDPDVPYLVRGILPRRGVAAVYGPPASGKTFLGMDLIFSLACGLPFWFCIPIKSAPVAYVPLEGYGGIKKRIKAWQQHNGADLGDRVQIWDEPFRLDDQGDVDALAQEATALLGMGCVIVIDTLAQAMAGFDENSSAEMGAAIAGAQRLASEVEGLVILIHHSGKDPTKGMRGHSSLLGALDASIEVSARASGRSWKVRKSKDGEAGQEYAFDLISYDLGIDPDGDPIGSCAVQQAIRPPSSELPPVKGPHRIAVMAKMLALTSHGNVTLDIEAAITAVAPDIGVAPKRQRTVARETINALIVTGHLVRNGDIITLST
jgi:putative DNA primase/helicase